ncbi:hypothetical protein BBP00_00007134 [Phytophthora kernoviae]|uniref:DNA polymerase n=1 Tax=Phytophthora kernoviae TaxID=325452 RepID=A0A3F2RJQ3_9STRA|nr:hypothetical protein BBP00_00007134 [Phytophthora kernoviae]
MGFVGLGIESLYPNRYSQRNPLNKLLCFCIGLLQMRVFIETIYTVVTSLQSGQEKPQSATPDPAFNTTDATCTRVVDGHSAAVEREREDTSQRVVALRRGLLYVVFIQVIVRDIPLFVLQANATIHYRKWKFIDLFTVISTFLTLTHGAAVYVAKEDKIGMQLLAFIFLVGQFVFRLGAILLMAMTTGVAILIYGLIITLFSILWVAKLRLAHSSERFVDQLPRAIVFFSFFTLFVVDGSNSVSSTLHGLWPYHKRVEIWQNQVEKLGGRVVHVYVNASKKAKIGAGSSVVDWKTVDLIVASSELACEKVAEFLHLDKFPPDNIETCTPDWLVYLLKEKKRPPEKSKLTWSGHQEARECEEKEEKCRKEIAQHNAEQHACDNKESRGESDESSGAKSSAQQQIGLKHYQDFLTKIPRAEAQQIERIVVDEVHKMIPNAQAQACGSYRRGKSACSDVDILITDPDAEQCGILPELLERLHAIGFLTDNLTHVSKQHTGGCDTYMGVCRVSEGLPYRRIDIKVYPRRFFGFATLHFTGSDHFNRSMRLFANKNGWNLSDRALTRVMRINGLKVKQGESVICESEVDVFIALGLEYKEPTERNCFDIKFLDEDEANAKKGKFKSIDE